MPKLVSIIMPVFNESKHLPLCLDSILGQSTPDWELLAVDDQSTDDSRSLLEEYARRDPRIRVLSSREKGIIPALRVAVDAASGTFITRMDADDYMAPHKLEALRRPLLQSGPGYISTALVAYFSDEFELGPGYQRYAQWLNDVIRTGRNWNEIYRECTIPSPCWMAFREDFTRAGGHTRDVNPEDYDLAFRFFHSGLSVLPVPEVLHFWRDHTLRSSRNLESHANQQYFRIKLPWFLEISYRPERPLILWGAGRKGKELASMLVARDIPFRWCCDTPSKWGHLIYGIRMESTRIIGETGHPQIILAVSGPNEQKDIDDALNAQGLQAGIDFFWFC